MRLFFKNIYIYSALFFITLIADIIVKVSFGVSIYRFITKPMVIILLLIFYFINKKENSKFKRNSMFLALLFFMIGDFFLILNENKIYYITGLSFFILAKMFYVLRFSNIMDFSLLRLMPYLVLCFIYISGIFILIQNNLNSYYYVILAYLFMGMIIFIFSLLRKEAVNSKSYYLVLIGIILSVVSDSITGLKSFYNSEFAFHVVTIMLFYGLSQYFIVMGIVNETSLIEDEEVEN